MHKRNTFKILQRLSIIIFTLLININSVFADDDSLKLVSREYKPSVGLGVGYFTYFGEIHHRSTANTFTGQMGYSIEFARGVSPHFDISLRVTKGVLSGNERTLTRNLNFKTDLFIGEVKMVYNFYPWISHYSKVHPFIGLGFESFEFNPKADLLDANGLTYHYWSDGSIRSIAQDAPNSNDAIVLRRDYIYETDLREANLDGLGKYPLVGFGFPISAGLNFEVSDRVRFKLNSTYHLTLTDNIDNISEAGIGVRKGNSENDNFFYTSASLHYDFLVPPKQIDDSEFEFPDFYALDEEDYDGDGVPAYMDSCAMTPLGVEVTMGGCPIDSDLDGVPDYKDHEIYSEEDAYVDRHGVELTDADFEHWYLEYMDSLEIPLEIVSRISGKPKTQGIYRVRIDRISGRIPEDQVDLYLAEEDLIASKVDYSTTDYITKQYAELDSAIQRRDELINKGLSNSEIIVQYKGQFITLDEYQKLMNQEETRDSLDQQQVINDLEGKIVTVLGTTEADASSTEKAQFYPNDSTITFPGEQNSTVYVNGQHQNEEEAKKNLSNVLQNFPDAEIKVVRNGKLEDLHETQVNQSNPTINDTDTPNTENTSDNINDHNDEFAIEINNVQNEDVEDLKNDHDLSNPIKNDNSVVSNFTNSPEKLAEKVEELREKGLDVDIVKINDGETEKIENNDGQAITVEDINIENNQPDNTNTPDNNDSKDAEDKEEDKFTVKIAEVEDNVSPEVTEKILSLPDVESVTTENPEKTTYFNGEFDNIEEAKEHAEELVNMGFEEAEVAKKDGDQITSLPEEDVYTPEEIAEREKNKNNIKSIEESEIKTGETVFRVQLGAYRKSVSTDIFKGVEVIAFPSEEGITKYLTGSFETYKDANIHKDKMKEQGFSDAWIVAYKDGKRVGVSQLISPEDYSQFKDTTTTESFVPVENNSVSDNNTPANGDSNYYTVQIGAFQGTPEKSYYENINGARVENDQGIHKVLVGQYKTYEEAIARQQELVDDGYPTSFIVKFKETERVQLDSGETNTQVQYNKNMVEIRVQIASFNEEIPANLRSKYDQLREVKYFEEDGKYKVTAGNFNDFESAVKYKQLLEELGYTDSFLIAYYNGEKITLPKAIRILEQQD